MRSRIALTALLATGALMSGGGAALGISALSTTQSAGGAQYGTTTTTTDTVTTTDTSGVLGTETTSEAPGAAGNSETLGTAASSNPRVDEVEASRQVQQQGQDTLPFTGYAAIPLLIGGAALLACGAVLRRRMDKDLEDEA